ncbi:transcription initiation factor TFIID subunit 8-like [Corylus avellana]|uniref:transcription initiation factor TFIID subunit 8-like n=1 Tax=Corylus avellana TaxID=13451 RepID=UPI001E1F44D5|nr:transcription initiation factor TFIID subunit 8-like [Corylus avellana]XP_059463079.1 transcription initiation factor TFIID subunit 8-like [Corylus avellana]
MSHGGVNVTRGNEQEDRDASRRLGADGFGRAVSKVAVAQICESVGFQSFKDSALEAITDIAIRYLSDLGKTARFYANLAGRTESNVFDIVRGLEELEASQGFPGASGVNNCLAGSGMVKGIIEYVGSAEEIPFAQPVPQFPVIKNRKLIPSFVQMGEMPPGKHMPAWLPALPDPHTYIHTPVWNERATDPRADKIEQARQRRKAERSLLSLQQRLLSDGAVGTSALASCSDVQELDGADKNPFLGTPLQPGQKDVSPVVLPSKPSALDEMVERNHISVLEAFAPAIEAVKGGFSDDGEDGKKGIPDVRPAVQLKFRTGKKFLGESLDLSLQKGGGRSAPFLARDEERDDKKRRAEFILKHTTEFPQELNQL